ncbi:MAG: hypothetical protein QM582_01025 [Micropruina sp.]|uniref:hypothetical protein n=1 Tax=Micropruina sp. TaxID=2737536 RepID=UPI0039E51B39
MIRRSPSTPSSPDAPARRRRAPLLNLFPLLLLTLAGCAAPANPPGGGVVSSGPLSPPSDAPTSPNRVTPEPISAARKQAFSKAEAVPGTSTVRVEGLLVGGPPCAVLGTPEVRETSSQVTITLWVGARQGAPCDGPQPAMEFPFVLDVTLDQPLGGRAVVDGAR